MKEERFLDLDCVAFQVTTRIASMPSIKFMEYSGHNVDLGRRTNGGKFEIRKENDIASSYLLEGKGVYFKGVVYFLKEGLEDSRFYRQFQSIYNKSRTKIEGKCSLPSEQFLMEHVDVHHIPIIKSIISLYNYGFFSFNQFSKKLRNYLKEEDMATVVSLIENEKVVA
ncbi:hypothetical protein NDS46_30760 (plasmid) [Paenibacillus thiaminolyticus]|uniref:hypothetical protein n=1 Tax=Paenibacillus thiaminolyticus TaxID=49283 RepID=UPI00232F3273|nr:hypothetical protein [Paenibacillus thiaminolyticus]WCF11728.1 hypothetical protein NDS46_30760 [Paenibacillus thiaminolyticus]